MKRKFTQQHIENLRKSHTGLKQTEITKQKKRDFFKDKPLSKEHAKKISESRLRRKKELGFINSPETRKNMSEARKGMVLSIKTREKMSENRKGSKHYNFGKKISEESKKKMSIIKINNPNRKFKETLIEYKIKKELEIRNITFKQNHPTLNIANVDFFIPTLGIIIECDGCFWHGCPEHNPTWDKRIQKDALKTKKLTEAGFKVFRFWEHEINKSPEECIDRVFF